MTTPDADLLIDNVPTAVTGAPFTVASVTDQLLLDARFSHVFVKSPEGVSEVVNITS